MYSMHPLFAMMPADPTGAGPSPLSMLLPILGMLLIFYFLMIRPQQKQEKARRALLAAVQKNDRVVTTGGIHGVVESLTEREAVLKLDSEGTMRIT